MIQCPSCGKLINSDNEDEISDDKIVGCKIDYVTLCNNYGGECKWESDDRGCREFRLKNKAEFIKVEDLI